MDRQDNAEPDADRLDVCYLPKTGLCRSIPLSALWICAFLHSNKTIADISALFDIYIMEYLRLLAVLLTFTGILAQGSNPKNDAAVGTLFKGRERSLAEKRLREQLLLRYDKPIMPNANNSQLFNLKIGMIFTGIQEIDCNKQRVTISAWMKLEWYDGRLTWFPDKNANISSLPFSDQDVYIPEVMLINRYKARDTHLFAPSMAIAYFHGEMIWLPPSSLDIHCSMDMSKWPFDSHQCVFVFAHASRDNTTFEMYPESSTVELDSPGYGTGEVRTHEWYISDSKVVRYTNFFAVGDNYDNVRFYLTFTRTPALFIRSCFLAPHVLLLVTLFMFATDEANVRHLFAVVELVGTLALGAVFWMIIPPAKNVPKIAYLTSSIPVLILTILMCSCLLDRVASSEASVPRFIAAISHTLSSLVPGKLCRRKRPVSSGQLVLTDGLTPSETDASVKWAQVAAQLRGGLFILCSIVCAFLIGLTY